MKPLVITVANQKGGVGKTTICLALANYLTDHTKGREWPVQVIDCDTQKSIAQRRCNDVDKLNTRRKGDLSTLADWRKLDLEYYELKEIPYKVLSYPLAESRNVRSLMLSLREDDMITLLDMPGSIDLSGIGTVPSMSDIIVIPFQWVPNDLYVTTSFIKYIRGLRTEIENQQLVFVPDMINPREGTAEEKEFMAKVAQIYSKVGTLTPEIRRIQELKRLRTFGFRDSQSEHFESAFTEIRNVINRLAGIEVK